VKLEYVIVPCSVVADEPDACTNATTDAAQASTPSRASERTRDTSGYFFAVRS
jgi:hypothetical protein